jgi:hypothetical protein
VGGRKGEEEGMEGWVVGGACVAGRGVVLVWGQGVRHHNMFVCGLGKS